MVRDAMVYALTMASQALMVSRDIESTLAATQ